MSTRAVRAAALYRKTQSIRAVMQKFACSFRTAKALIVAGGGKLLPLRRKSNLTKEAIVKLYETNGVEAIAKLNGTSRTVVLHVLYAAGVVMRSRGNNDVRIPPVVHGYCRDAKKFGLPAGRYVRLMAIIQLGGRCSRCGEKDLYVLEINHINGNDAPQRHPTKRRSNARYEQYCQILNGHVPSTLEVTCCNCNRRHEVERGNIPLIPQELLCLQQSQLKSSTSAARNRTKKKLPGG